MLIRDHDSAYLTNAITMNRSSKPYLALDMFLATSRSITASVEAIDMTTRTAMISGCRLWFIEGSFSLQIPWARCKDTIVRRDQRQDLKVVSEVRKYYVWLKRGSRGELKGSEYILSWSDGLQPRRMDWLRFMRNLLSVHRQGISVLHLLEAISSITVNFFKGSR